MVQNEEKANTPKRDAIKIFSYAKRGHNAPDAQYKKNPPALGTPIILGFHYHRMKQSNDKKCTNADEQSRKMIFV